MAKLKSVGELETLRKSITGKRDPDKAVITVCNGTGCHAHGCKAVTAAFQEEVRKRKLQKIFCILRIMPVKLFLTDS